MARTGRTFEGLVSGFGLMLTASYLIQESETFRESVWSLQCLIDGRCLECGYKLEARGHAVTCGS